MKTVFKTAILFSIIAIVLLCGVSSALACNTHEYKQCYGNAVYWFDHCGVREDLFSQCTANQTCQNQNAQNATCVNNPVPPVFASCQANPGSIQTNQSSTFTASPTGGNGTFNYLWSGACNGSSQSCTSTFPNSGTQNATVTVSSGGQSTNANCSVSVAPATPTLSVTCQASPSSIQTGQSSTFIASPTGGTGTYNYSWSGVCTSSATTCTSIFSTPGTQNETLTVTSGSQTAPASCSVSVTSAVINHDHRDCYSGDVYWYSSTNVRNDLYADCTSSQICQNAQCVNVTCNSSADCSSQNGYIGTPYCSGTSVYQTYRTYTCNNQGTANSSCVPSDANQKKNDCQTNQTCANGSCSNVSIACTTNADCGANSSTGSLFCQGNSIYQNYITHICNNQGTANSYCSAPTTAQFQSTCAGNQTCNNGSCGNSCSSNPYQRCVGNNLYSYDSCGVQQGSPQYCPNGCLNNYCQNYIQPIVYNNATLTATKTVRDITTSSGWASSVYASPSDMVMFMITLQAQNQDAQNVFVRDTLPANLIYNNQLTVACTGSTNYSGYNNNCNSNNYNYSGSIISGISLNTIYAGQTVTITYQAQLANAINFAFGTTTLNNLATVTSSNASAPSASASVIVARATVLAASTVSTGLTNNFWLDSFFLPFLITLIGIWMWRSGMFFGIEKWLDNKRKIRRGFKAEKELSSRISNIQKSGR